MNTSETLIRFVRRHLDGSLTFLPQSRLERLRQAREFALSRQKQPAFLGRMAAAGQSIHLDFFAQRALARFAALLVVSGALAFWHAHSYIDHIEELDSAILTDEMPIDIITDKGFNEWLQASGEH